MLNNLREPQVTFEQEGSPSFLALKLLFLGKKQNLTVAFCSFTPEFLLVPLNVIWNHSLLSPSIKNHLTLGYWNVGTCSVQN